MKILGVSHDVLLCSAAVCVDGKVVSAIAEERLDRRKLSRVFPELAIQRCLQEAGLRLEDVDEVAIGWNPAIDLETVPSGFLEARRWRTEHFSQVPGRFMRLLGSTAPETVTMSAPARGAPPVTYVNHYDAHLANGLYLSPFDEAAVCILDGRAERSTSLLAHARGTHIERLAEVVFPHSLGLLYGAITQLLGFKPDSDEWKVMALASFAAGENELTPKLRRMIHVGDDGKFEVDLSFFEWFNFFDRRMYGDRLVTELGPPRRKGDPLTPHHERLAASMQLVFEESVAKLLRVLHAKTGSKRLVCSGGCFMNSVFNGKIPQLTPFEEVFITSCPDDSGTAIGAALHLEALRTGTRPHAHVKHNYWGPQYSDAECLDVARRYKLPSKAVDDPAKSAAQDLVDGRIVGWFQGRMEFGQRALGNRSILLDPRRPDGRDVVNAAIKFREGFRPFAPAVLQERVADWFECDARAEVPFMERVFMFRPEKRRLVPSVVHVDGSGRLQTVDDATSPRYHALIREFEKLTGVPIVLNTSFNLNGEPIVCSPEDAVRTFFTCALDVLYLGNVRVTKGA
jgi:carbamoyltransferase